MRDSGETWLQVVGWEGFYDVSSLGRVRSISRRALNGSGGWRITRSIILSQRANLGGYLRVHLSRPGAKPADQYVHRLVAEAFLGTAPSLFEVCHNDGYPANNRVENLRWDTHSANVRDTVAAGTHAATARTHCPRGHALRGGNLKASQAHLGHRACLACDRARKRVIPSGWSLQQVADLCYAELEGHHDVA